MDEPLELSSAALAALQSFYAEQAIRQSQLEDLQKSVQADRKHLQVSMELFQEDWQLSQFWYDEATSRTLARELIRLANQWENQVADAIHIVCISAPSAFVALQEVLTHHSRSQGYLFEFDERFSVFKSNYIHYDYAQAEVTLNCLQSSHPQLIGAAHIILLDPPFLSTECLSRTAAFVKQIQHPDAKIILCTGKIMTCLAQELLNVEMTLFEPKHRGGLSNDFGCFVNYSGTSLQ